MRWREDGQQCARCVSWRLMPASELAEWLENNVPDISRRRLTDEQVGWCALQGATRAEYERCDGFEGAA